MKRNKTKYNHNYFYTEEGKTSVEFLEIIAIGAATVGTCAYTGCQIGLLVGGPPGAKIGAGIGAIAGSYAAYKAVNFYYTVKMNKDRTVDVTFTR